MEKSSIALMSVWHTVGSLRNGPTLSSLLGIVRLNACPPVEPNSMSITAGSEASSEHGMPKVPASPLKGWMSGEMSA